MEMIIPCKHEFGVLKHCLHIDLIRRIEASLSCDLIHNLVSLLDLCLNLRLLYCLFAVLEDGLDNIDVVFVEVKGEHGVGCCEIIASGLEGPVLADHLHRV